MSDLFPLNEYRGHEARDASVKVKTPSAKALVVDTQFDGATADTLAAQYLAATKNPATTYSVIVDEAMSLDDLATAIPRIAMTYRTIEGFTGRLVAMKVNRTLGQTTLTFRGDA